MYAGPTFVHLIYYYLYNAFTSPVNETICGNIYGLYDAFRSSQSSKSILITLGYKTYSTHCMVCFVGSIKMCMIRNVRETK